jgi:drug/metabolite transporter (DMT)-like permease
MPNQTRSSIPPLLGLTIGIFASSTASIFIRYAQEFAPSLVIAAYRLGIASLILLPILIQRERKILASLDASQIKWVVGSGFFLSIHFATWITSLEYTTVANAVVFVSMAPLFVALASPMFLNEPIHPSIKSALALALLGTVIIAVSDVCHLDAGLQCPPLERFFTGESLKGDLLAIGGAIAGAGYILVGRKVRAEIALLPYIGMVYSIAALFLITYVFIAGLEPFRFPPITYLWFLLLALFPQLVGHSMINWALRFMTAAYVSITLLGEPIGSSILAFLILDEVPNFIMLSGAVLILSGIIMASLRQSSSTEVGTFETEDD